MPDIYFVTKEGVYRHEIVGCFDNRSDALLCAEKAARAEHDDYHCFDVNKIALGGTEESSVARVKRTDKRHFEGVGWNGKWITDSTTISIGFHSDAQSGA